MLERRPPLDIGVGQPRLHPRSELLGRVLRLHARGDVRDGDAGVAAAALAGRAGHEPHDAAVVRRLVEVVVTAADEDRLQVRRPLGGGVDLHRREVGDADHADVAVAPRLGRDPLDEVVGVLAERHAAGVVVADHLAAGGARAAQVGDDVGVVLLDDAGDVAGLEAAVPQRAGATLRRQLQRLRLEVLAVGAHGDERGPRLVLGAAVHVDGEGDPVAHRHVDVGVDLDRLATSHHCLASGHQCVLPCSAGSNSRR